MASTKTRTINQNFSYRPSSTGGGGGTTGGGTSGGYDRYIGTLGLAADAPKGSKFSNYTTFPAAEKYDWVKVTTPQRVNGILVYKDQKWMCSAKTEKDLPANWELLEDTQRSSLKMVASFSRSLYAHPVYRIVPTSSLKSIPLENPVITGDYPVAFDFFRTDISKWFEDSTAETFTLDISAFVQYAFNPNNSRSVAVGIGMFYNQPTFGSKSASGTLLVGDNVLGIPTYEGATNESEVLTVPVNYVQASTDNSSGVAAIGDSLSIDIFGGIQVVVYCYAYQNSGKPVNIETARLSVRIYDKH